MRLGRPMQREEGDAEQKLELRRRGTGTPLLGLWWVGRYVRRSVGR